MTMPSGATVVLAKPRRIRRAVLLAGLAAVVVLVAILTPEPTNTQQGGLSVRSTAGGGARMLYELTERMGWRPRERDVPFDSTMPASVEAVLSPAGALSEREVHRLLDHVRAGGGLLFDATGNDELADSLGLETGRERFPIATVSAQECPPTSGVRARAEIAFPPGVHELRWRRPPPGEVTSIVIPGSRNNVPFGIEFPLGRGRVAVLASSEVFTNDAIRRCGWGADVAVARALEYVRPGGPAPTIEFDEFHHGFGAHPGSFTAIAMYLSKTASGRFLAEALFAGALLLLAVAPRPVPPRDSERIVRRSPLEHADALARAYSDVGATRTAMQRLVSGLRRRTARVVHAPSNIDDAEFLDIIARRVDGTDELVRGVRRALDAEATPRELVAAGDALGSLERRIDSTFHTST